MSLPINNALLFKDKTVTYPTLLIVSQPILATGTAVDSQAGVQCAAATQERVSDVWPSAWFVHLLFSSQSP